MPELSHKVSVLIPICNVEKYLDQCLTSVEAQTYSDLEIIGINDGSADSSLEILQAHAEKDGRIRIIDKPNSGYGDSMNKGLETATGTYIAILESDDFMAVDAIEKLVYAAQTFDAQVVKANFDFYWSAPEERRVLHEMFRPEQCNKLVEPNKTAFIFHQKPSIWSALYRRDFLLENNIKFLPTPGASFQDASFTFKVFASATRAVYLHDPVVEYRQDNENSSVHTSNKVECTNVECAETERWLKEDFAKTAPKSEVDRLVRILHVIKYDLYMWTYIRLAPEYHIQFLERMASEYRAAIKAGEFSTDDLASWKKANLQAILASPTTWEQKYGNFANEGKLGRALHYARVGSPAVLVDYVRSMLTHTEA